MDILAISGSLRAESTNTALLRAAAALAPEDVHITIFEGLGCLPFFDPGLEPEHAPAPVLDFRARLRAADAVLICTPEYAHGMPGVLKNALEWTVASGEFVDKPVVLLSTSPAGSGGAKALAWLRQTLAVMSARILEDLSQPIPFGRSRVKPSGEVVDSALTVTLRSILECLVLAVAAPPVNEALP